MFSVPPCSNEAKSVDCIGSGTASNTCNETSNHQAEARGSGAVSSTFERYDSSDALPAVHSSEHAVSKYGSMLNKGRKREVLIDDVVGSASSGVTSTLDGTAGVRGKRNETDRDQSIDNLRNTSSISVAGRTYHRRVPSVTGKGKQSPSKRLIVYQLQEMYSMATLHILSYLLADLVSLRLILA